MLAGRRRLRGVIVGGGGGEQRMGEGQSVQPTSHAGLGELLRQLSWRRVGVRIGGKMWVGGVMGDQMGEEAWGFLLGGRELESLKSA